jgi:hypothetical protein
LQPLAPWHRRLSFGAAQMLVPTEPIICDSSFTLRCFL